jgi:hypothetical protein
MSSTEDVAKWMFEQLENSRSKELDQQDAAYKIGKLFGAEFVYRNANGNPAIDKEVLTEFRKLTRDSVVWGRGGRYWRKRTPQNLVIFCFWPIRCI